MAVLKLVEGLWPTETGIIVCEGIDSKQQRAKTTRHWNMWTPACNKKFLKEKNMPAFFKASRGSVHRHLYCWMWRWSDKRLQFKREFLFFRLSFVCWFSQFWDFFWSINIYFYLGLNRSPGNTLLILPVRLIEDLSRLTSLFSEPSTTQQGDNCQALRAYSILKRTKKTTQ